MEISTVTQRLCDANCHAVDIAYQATPLCQTYLPRQEPDSRTWTRRNGAAILEIEAGRMADPTTGEFTTLPLPYGTHARIVLIYIITEAIKHQTKIINLSRSHNKFANKIYGYRNGKRTTELRKQMIALGKATIRIAVPTINGHEEHELKLARNFDIHHARGRAIWPGSITLTEDYYNLIQQRAVPINYNHIAALRHNAFAMDMYCWIVHKTATIQRPTTITWQSLAQQFCPEYGIKDARRQLRRTLGEVVPLLNVTVREVENGTQPHGLSISPGGQPIARQ